MKRYEVTQRGPGGHALGTVVVPADSPVEAVAWVRCLADPGTEVGTFAVYRRRRARRRRFEGLFGGLGGDDGTAGVREPRRPHPAPPSLRAEAELPAYPQP
jgi:hypothetical protein